MSISLKKPNDCKKRIMVMDDDPGILDALKMLLQEFGYEVHTTKNGKLAYDDKKDLPDLILLDLWMSGVNGRDVCIHLKGQKLTKDVPIILFSANKDIANIAREVGADDFIAKPFHLNDLLAMVEKHVG